MLAYVFWHWHLPQIEMQEYERYLVAFHQVLYECKPTGFQQTRVLKMQQASWLARDAYTYEDWHSVVDAAALDPLNEQAVTGLCQEPHQRVARCTEGGVGGLYHVVMGQSNLPVIRFAYRFNKPAGMTYAALYELVGPLVATSGCLWQRHMNLGPGPEFCLHSAAALMFPESLVLVTLAQAVEQLCLTGTTK